MEEQRVDVLVVGGGLAGLQAALSASEAGARVAVCAKGQPGRSGSSATTSAGYAAVMPEWLDEDDPSRHFEDTMRGGADIADPELVRILCDEGPILAKRLEALGGDFRREDGRYTRSAAGDHSHPRSLGAKRRLGVDYTLPLTRRIQDAGVALMGKTQICEIVVEDADVHGAVALDTASQRPFAIAAHAVVIACGGLGQLYPVTSNPRDVTGDGFALAIRAGAGLRDLEFIQFYPWRCIDPFDNRISFQPATWSVGGRLFNAAGDRFMSDYDQDRMEATTRDLAARAIFDQVRRGLGVGGGVRVDLSQVSEADLQDTNPKLLEGLRRRGIDYRTYPLVAAPEAHYAMGGAAIDVHGACDVSGLFAAGESAGGVQGANRLSNNALPEALVFGHRAGQAAAARREGRTHSATAGQAADRWARRGSEAAEQEDTDTSSLRTELQNTAFRALGIVRNEKDLGVGLGSVESWRERVDALAAQRPLSRPVLELRNLGDVAQVAMTSALRRAESRGAHVREDRPLRDDGNWRGSIFVHRRPNGVLAYDFRPAAPTKEFR